MQLTPYQQEKLQRMKEEKNPALSLIRLLADKSFKEMSDKVFDEVIKRLEDIKGYNPVKGKDYFTPEEIDCMIEYMESRIVVPPAIKGDKGDTGNPGRNGETPIRGVDYWNEEDKKKIRADLEKMIPKLKEVIPPSIDDIIKELKKSPVAYDEIKGAPNLKDIEKLVAFLKQGGFRGGGVPSLQAGQGIVLTKTSDGGYSITSTASGGGITPLTATGAVDGTNGTFTFTEKPDYIVIDGQWYRENYRWTWSGLTATVSPPPNDDIYGVKNEVPSNKGVLLLSANSATPAIDTNLYDVVHITSQTANITSFTTGLTGTPQDGDRLRISITGTGSVGITWGTSFESSNVILPNITTGTTRLDCGFFWNTETSKWRCMCSS